ncbi:MAG: hypothetical protein CMO26_19335 [Thiotrichales bacterium]|nr:hypothetical protein [Thiotrichales bacterium]|tara:strand:- start:4419 stop:6155 length:1737 start_codon:yes stop_codon:yes gene_type:complete
MNDISKAPEGKIAGGHMLARAIKAKGIDRIFALCGGFINPALIGCQDYDIDIVAARSEMEAGFLATATARMTREVQVCLAEPSGFTNYVSAVAEAHFAGDPVIFIGISGNSHNFDNHGFKELPQAEVVKCMTKYSIEVNEPGRIGWFFDKAYDIATNQPSGPVQLTIPTNFIFTKQIDAEPPKGARDFDASRRKIHRPYPNAEDLKLVETALQEAKKPAIVAGQGLWSSDAEKDLEEFAAAANIPVFGAFTYVKAMNQSHPMAMGLLDYYQNTCSRLIGEECDLLILLGAKLDFPLNFGEAPLINPDTRMITVNATARELSDNMLADERICADLKMFIQCLHKGRNVPAADGTWVSRLRQSRSESVSEYRQFLEQKDGRVHPMRITYDTLMTLGEEDILVLDGGDIACWGEIAINAWAMEGRKVGGIFAPGPWEQMGTGPAFATAMQLAKPDSRVVLITGDGSLGLAPGFTPMETAIDRGISVTMVVANNAQWGMIQEQQKAMYGRIYATKLRDVDYYKIFESAGAHAQVVTEADAYLPALNEAMDTSDPAFIEVKSMPTPSPVTQGLIDMRVRTSIE